MENDAPVVGLLHPGEMGASIGGALRDAGITVRWASEGRSADTQARAEAAGLTSAGGIDRLVVESDVLLVICSPHAAVEVALSVAGLGFAGVYVDANAVAPATAERIAAVVARGGASFVDADLIGGPIRRGGAPRLFLSGEGEGVDAVARLFAGTPVEALVVGRGVEASALKMCYAAWTKGTSALLLAIRALARSSGVEGPLLDEWARSQPDLAGRCDAAIGVVGRAWRYAGEMEEIAAAMAAVGLPDGFGRAAAGVYSTLAGFKGGHPPADDVLGRLLGHK
jgi:3-hydroxyisobutyrate dehydrogenase-like beta-hydroxyacid dehydrogenase